jgi:cytidylate kinase
MSQQRIISISREYGCNGHDIAQKLAEVLKLPLYDKKMLDDVAKENNVDADLLQHFDEKSRNPLLSRRVGEHNNSIEDYVANIQFDYLKKKAEEGESFVVIGRCSDYILKDYPLVSVFISGDMDKKIKNVMLEKSVNEDEAENLVKKYDKKRKQYHNSYCESQWGVPGEYDICINSSRIDVDTAVELINSFLNLK